MNIFEKTGIANKYDAYYQAGFGKKVDEIEKSIISTIIKDIPLSDMLELGCGTGHWTDYFIKQGFNVTGIDISEAMIKLAIEKKIEANFIKADSQNLPFEDEEFAVVSSITMIEFVADQDQVFQEIFRVLKPGGRLILGCLNANSVLGKTKEQNEVFANAHFLTPEELTDKLKIFGKIKFGFGVYLDSNFNLLDNTNNRENVEPGFMAAIIQKNKL